MTYVLLIIAFVAIIYGANWFVDGAVGIARRLKISDFVIGAVIVGVGTSLPELIVSLKGAFDGNASVSIGNVVGSNTFNVLAILSLTAIVYPVTITRENLRKDIPRCLALSLFLLLLAFNFFNGTQPTINNFDGIALLAFFAFFMYDSLRNGKQDGSTPEELADAKPMSIGKAVAMIAVGAVVLIIGCDTFVDQAIVIAK
ncbi:MAG: sodium:calcium antiporter, partial [Tidjanibacter sp.]|nr:sodium:calcium antiporter [Tidjanibacter sp.]